MKISSIIPVHSETDSLRYVVNTLSESLKDRLHEVILITSPYSAEETFFVVEELCKRYSFVKNQLQQENPGVGRAVRQGFLLASGTHILMIDSDGEMNPHTVLPMITKMVETGCDMVVASRWIKGGGVRGYDPVKYILNRTCQLIFRILYRSQIHDLTLGFKLVKKEVIDSIHWNSIFNEIGAETTLRPIKMGYRVEEVPTIWVRRGKAASKNPFRRNFRYVIKAAGIFLESK